MNTYRLCGLAVDCETPLPELPPAEEDRSDFSFRLAAPRDAEAEWFHAWHLPDGRLWLRLGRLDAGHLLRFPGLADFEVLQREIVARPADGTPENTWRHLLLDQVFPLALSLRGELVLHGSATALPSGAAAFLGAAGIGKSTLAASFAREGFPAITDDCLLLRGEGDRILAVPSYPGLRLWENGPRGTEVAHYSPKKRVTDFAFASRPAPLERAYFLEEAPQVEVVPVSPRDAVLEAVKISFLMEPEARGPLRACFEAACSLAERLPARRLRFPSDLDRLPEVRAAVLIDMERPR